MPVDKGSIGSVCSTIKSNEDNQQLRNTGPAINNVPAVRGSHSNHFDPMGGTGTPMGGGKK